MLIDFHFELSYFPHNTPVFLPHLIELHYNLLVIDRAFALLLSTGSGRHDGLCSIPAVLARSTLVPDL